MRELKNALERALILAGGESSITVEHLVFGPTRRASLEPTTLADAERAVIVRALGVEQGNRRRAAARLGIGERTLYDKLKRYGV